MKNVFVSILNFNGQKSTEECLASLDQIIIENVVLSVVILDNHSSEKLSIEKKQYKNLHIEVFYSSENTGFSGGHNRNITFALEQGADYVLILNNDTLVDKKFLQLLIKAIETDHVGVTVPKIYYAKGSEYHKNRYKENELGRVLWYGGGIIDMKNILGLNRGVDEVDAGQYEKEQATEQATGCCMLVKAEVLKKVGLFDKRYFLYYEDSDLSLRIRSAGYILLYVPTAVIYHKNAESSGGSGSSLQDYYITRNRLLFAFSHASLRAKIAIVKQSMVFLAKGRTWQRKGIIDFFLLKFGKGTYVPPK